MEQISNGSVLNLPKAVDGLSVDQIFKGSDSESSSFIAQSCASAMKI